MLICVYSDSIGTSVLWPHTSNQLTCHWQKWPEVRVSYVGWCEMTEICFWQCTSLSILYSKCCTHGQPTSCMEYSYILLASSMKYSYILPSIFDYRQRIMDRKLWYNYFKLDYDGALQICLDYIRLHGYM